MNVEHPSSRTDLRNALLCGLAVVAAVAIVNPVCESPFNDDWSYSFTVKRLLETGRLTYNGWAAASFIAQAYWGLLWVKVFGYSYTVLRLSTLPLAAGAVSLCYLLGRRAGLLPGFAIFAALSLGLSPLFLPVTCSFMSDVPGLFCIFLSLYLLARAMESPRISVAILLLITGVVVGFIGGTGRQIVWVVPVVVVPYSAWIRRKDAHYVTAAIVSWITVLAGLFLTMHWFAQQPYSIPESPIPTQLKLALHKPAHFLLNVLAIGLTLIWMLLPALWRVFRNWNDSRAAVAFALLIGVVLLAVGRHRYIPAPWMNNTLTSQGVMGGAELYSPRPIAMPNSIRIAIAVAVFSAACVVVADILLWLGRPLRAFHQTVNFFCCPDRNRTLLPAMTLFATVYFLLLLPRTASDQTYDRYILPLMPCVLFPLLLSYQAVGSKIPKSAWGLLGFYAIVAVIITQDVMALDRARTVAVHRLVDAGIPRTAIDAGFEINYETQLFARGYINDHRLKIPRGAYDKTEKATPAVTAEYRIEYSHGTDTVPTQFGSVSYLSFLYPFHRKIFIDRFANPDWLNRLDDTH